MMCTSSRINLGFACTTSNNPMNNMLALPIKRCKPFLEKNLFSFNTLAEQHFFENEFY